MTVRFRLRAPTNQPTGPSRQITSHTTWAVNVAPKGPLHKIAIAPQGAFKEHYMADDLKKNPDQQSEQPGKQPGQSSELGHKNQPDSPKRNPSRQDQDEEQNDQQQGGQRRAS